MPERPNPKLPLEVQAEIELAQERVRNEAQLNWPMLFGAQSAQGFNALFPKYPRQAQLKLQLRGYATALFDLEAAYYPQYAKDELELQGWLAALAANLLLEMSKDLDAYKSAHDFHCPIAERQDAIMDALLERTVHWLEISKHQYKLSLLGGKLEPLLASSAPSPRPELEQQINASAETKREIEPVANITTTARLPGTVNSPSAARKMEAYITSKGFSQTEFASLAQTTDRTLRAFRKSGKVRRDIFEQIAKAMGTTRDDLLKP